MKQLVREIILCLQCVCCVFLAPNWLQAQNSNDRIEDFDTDAVMDEARVGVFILEKGSLSDAFINQDGCFFLTNALEGALLQFSYLGYEALEIKATAERREIKLKESVKFLEQVLVVGYGTHWRIDVTSAISTVNTKDIAERPVTSVAAAMPDKSAGVQVIQPSGLPGSEMLVSIRRNISISTSNSPPYVVDRIPTSDVRSVLPLEIESMQIFKDTSSAVIYYSQASSG